MELVVKLKVCEACGSIFTCPSTQGNPYCGRCTAALKDFPTPESRKRRGRPSRTERMFRSVEVEA